MLFPGCRIRVVESTVKGTTGPILESMGFVSEYRSHFNLVELNRAVWFRYGKNGKKRMETGNFICRTTDKPTYHPKLKYRSGRIEIAERGNVQKMDYMEFLCWAYSILKLKKPDWEYQEMRQLLNNQFEMKLNKYSIRRGDLIHNDFVNSPAGREAMANVCRHMRHLYYKRQVREIKKNIKHVSHLLHKDLKRHKRKEGLEFSPESYAEYVRGGHIGGGLVQTYVNFFNKFNHDAFLYSKAENLCKDDEWVLEIVKQYKNAT